jgi:hypothetical protein
LSLTQARQEALAEDDDALEVGREVRDLIQRGLLGGVRSWAGRITGQVTSRDIQPSAGTRAAPATASPPGADGAGAATGQIVVVRGTGASGARLRGQPGNNGQILAVIPEYSPLVVAGPDRNVDGIVWRNVRAPNGTEGRIAASFVTTGQP